jgi:dihydropteroate synthase
VIPVATEIGRVLPVIRALAASGVAVSIDTRNAETMRAALGEGARIVNDVSALAHDPQSASVVARHGCPVVLMHMRGTPATMTKLNHYGDVVVDVAAELSARVAFAEASGIARDRIAIDPGIGFAKAASTSINLLRRLDDLLALDLPLLVGVSRKGFIGGLSGETQPNERVGGSIAAAMWAIGKGASVVRVHDVAATVQAVRVWRGLAELS